MTSQSSQRMKPITAARKLGVYLPATPEEFQQSWLTRAELAELESHPPQWLADLRKQGPHPRAVVAGRLGISIAGLARGGVEEALTTEQINELRNDPPAWLEEERETHRRVLAEEEERKEKQRKIEQRKQARGRHK